MAKAGTYSAYQRSTPIQEDFSDQMQSVEQMHFRREQAKKQEERFQQQRSDKLNEQFDEDIEAMSPVISNIKSVDEIMYRATSKGVERLGEIYRTWRENPSTQNDPALRMEVANIKNFPKVVKASQEKLIPYAKGLAEGFANGTYSEWDRDILDEMEAYFGVEQEDGSISPNFIVDFDKQGMAYSVLKTKDGKLAKRSFADIINGYKYGEPTKAIDLGTLSKTEADKLGKRKKVNIGGKFIYEEQSFDSHEPAVRNRIRAMLGTVDNPSDVAKSLWVDEINMNRDKTEFGEGSLKEIEDHLVEQIRMQYDETTEVKERRREPATTSSEENKTVAGTGIELMRGIDGSPLKPMEGPDMDSYAFSMKKAVDLGVGDKTRKFNKLYIDNSGTITASGEIKVEDSSSGSGLTMPGQKSESGYKTYTTRNIEDINIIARQNGFADAAELKQFLMSKTRTTSFGLTESQKQEIRDKYQY